MLRDADGLTRCPAHHPQLCQPWGTPLGCDHPRDHALPHRGVHYTCEESTDFAEMVEWDYPWVSYRIEDEEWWLVA